MLLFEFQLLRKDVTEKNTSQLFVLSAKAQKLIKAEFFLLYKPERTFIKPSLLYIKHFLRQGLSCVDFSEEF